MRDRLGQWARGAGVHGLQQWPICLKLLLRAVDPRGASSSQIGTLKSWPEPRSVSDLFKTFASFIGAGRMCQIQRTSVHTRQAMLRDAGGSASSIGKTFAPAAITLSLSLSEFRSECTLHPSAPFDFPAYFSILFGRPLLFVQCRPRSHSLRSAPKSFVATTRAFSKKSRRPTRRSVSHGGLGEQPCPVLKLCSLFCLSRACSLPFLRCASSKLNLRPPPKLTSRCCGLVQPSFSSSLRPTSRPSTRPGIGTLARTTSKSCRTKPRRSVEVLA